MHFMIRNRFCLAALCLMMAFTATQAQTLRSYVKAGDAAFESGAYEQALAYYKVATEVEPNDNTYHYKAGEAARFLSAHQVAESFYSKISDEARTGEMAEANYGQALSNMYLGNYDKAIGLFDKYIAGNGSMASFAKTQREHAIWAKSNSSKMQEQAPVRLDAPTNTNYTDFAPVYKDGALYASSSWKATEADPSRLRIFRIKDENRDVVSVEGIDNNYDIANPTFFGNKMYCSVRNNAAAFKGFQLAVCTAANDGSYSAPRLLEAEGTQGTQPSIGYDSISRKNTLYFSSTRDGGKGGSDIWAAPLTDDGIGAPVNLSALNTAFDEVTPMFYTEHQMLHFSSNGHDNLGGFDVFRSQRLGEYTKPKNVGAPINSSYDDLYYFSAFDSGRAYLSSNRPGNMCANPSLDCQCSDIYESKFELALQVNTFNQLTSAKLDSSTVRLVNLKTGLEEKMEFNPKSNQFYFPLKYDQDYMLVSTRGELFTNDTTRFTTRGITGSKTITQNLYMKPAGLFLDVFVFDALTKQPLSASTVALDNIGDAAAADRSTNTPSNDFHYSVSANQKYRIEASKAGYSTDIIEFAIPNITGGRRIVKNVYLARTVDLPATVYFENDYPDPDTRNTTTKVSYDTHNKYYAGLRKTYITNYGNATEINSFFDNEVLGSMDRLNRVCESLNSYLQQGYSLNVVFEGFASPRFESDYNVFLTQRRIQSVLNYFNAWNGGVMATYIASGKLRVSQQPNGETQSASGVNDVIANPKLSWYAPAAARERRVTVVDIRRQAGSLSIEYDGKYEVR